MIFYNIFILQVSCYRYPSVLPEKSEASIYTGHSSHVTCVRWIGDRSGGGSKAVRDRYLISTGGGDKCVFQWRHEGEVQERNIHQSRAEVALKDIIVTEEEEEGKGYDLDPIGGGDEFMAIKPWLGAIVAPSTYATDLAQGAASSAASHNNGAKDHKELKDMRSKKGKKDFIDRRRESPERNGNTAGTVSSLTATIALNSIDKVDKAKAYYSSLESYGILFNKMEDEGNNKGDGRMRDMDAIKRKKESEKMYDDVRTSAKKVCSSSKMTDINDRISCAM